MEAGKKEGENLTLSRRQFLELTGFLGLNPIFIPLGTSKLPQKLKIPPAKLKEGVQLKPQNIILSCLRADDLLYLHFELINLRIVPGAPPKLVRQNPADPAYLVVHFPPQSFGEEVVDNQKIKSPPIGVAISGPTRLAFKIPEKITEIPLTLEQLLSWENYEPSLVPVALPPQASLAAQKPPVIFRPESHQTAIELPYRLILSPHSGQVWIHAIKINSDNGFSGLWHTRLCPKRESLISRRILSSRFTMSGVSTPASPAKQDMKASKPEEESLALRAVWSDDFRPDTASPPEFPTLHGFDTPLSPEQRNNIVHLTSNFQIRNYSPLPLRARHLMLTSLGGWLEVAREWSPPSGLSVESWRYSGTMGRDHYVKIVEKGFLLPFGHRASLIQITQRNFKKDPEGKQYAYLIKEQFIVIRQEEKIFPDPRERKMNKARGLPFRRVRLIEKISPKLDNPPKDEVDAFWPRVNNKDYKFHCLATDWAGNQVEFDLPLLFVKANINSKNNLNKLINIYQTEKERREANFSGQKITVAPPRKMGDTELEIDRMTFTLAAIDEPFEELLVFPLMEKATVFVPALKYLAGVDKVDVAYFPGYVNNGFDGNENKGEVFLSLLLPILVDFALTSSGAGGIATPNFFLLGLSRLLGPVGGALENSLQQRIKEKKELSNEEISQIMSSIERALWDITKGKFDPENFFTEEAKLFGNILLKKIIAKVEDFASDLAKEYLPEELKEAGKKIKEIKYRALTIKNELEKNENGLPQAIHTYLIWQPSLNKFDNLFIPAENSSMEIRAEAITYFNGQPPRQEIKGELTNFKLNLFFIEIAFDRVGFLSRKGEKADFDVKIKGVTLGPPLTFVEELLKLIEVKLGLGPTPKIIQTKENIQVGFIFGLPNIPLGVFSLQNIKFLTLMTLSFKNAPLLLRFAFNEREKPFLVAISPFAGEGFFAIELTPGGVQMVEGLLSFGGTFSLDIGVASGGLILTAGIYFLISRESGALSITVSGFVKCEGCLEVLGLVNITAIFYMELAYVEKENVVKGQATVTAKVEVMFFSKEVELTVERSFGHSTSPRFADLMSREHWETYCQAFA